MTAAPQHAAFELPPVDLAAIGDDTARLLLAFVERDKPALAMITADVAHKGTAYGALCDLMAGWVAGMAIPLLDDGVHPELVPDVLASALRMRVRGETA